VTGAAPGSGTATQPAAPRPFHSPTITFTRNLTVPAAGPSHPLDSEYFEQFWLPTAGPSLTVLLRRLARQAPDKPVDYDLETFARALGLGVKQFHATLLRGARFRLLGPTASDKAWPDWNNVNVALAAPTLNDAQLARLPLLLRRWHPVFLEQLGGPR
jgi:hypothetical protein